LEGTAKDNIKKNQCTFVTLSAWYKEQMKSESPKRSPRKKSKSNPVLQVAKKPVLVIIPNVEGFSPQILQNFILIAR
jgi:hypothetical protein